MVEEIISEISAAQQDIPDTPISKDSPNMEVSVWYEPEEAKVDIVFVHGYSGRADGTWRSQGILWPREWLAKDFPQARILSVDYRALSGDYSSCLLSQLKSHSVGVRPIIFITHSIGVFLIKKVLSLDFTSTEGEGEFSTSNVLTNTKGIVFYATPHKFDQRVHRGKIP